MTRRGRDKHTEVGAAMRQAIRRANGARLSEGEHRTFDAVLALTAGFGKLWDDVYVADVRDLTGETEETRLHERTVRGHLLGLARRGLIGWEPRRGTDSTGKGFPSKVALPHVEQTEPSRHPVSFGGQTGPAPGDRVKQPPHREEDLEQEGFTYTPRAREGDPDDELIDRLWKESAPRHPGAYSEPNS
jgi:hypothetical protein